MLTKVVNDNNNNNNNNNNNSNNNNNNNNIYDKKAEGLRIRSNCDWYKNGVKSTIQNKLKL